MKQGGNRLFNNNITLIKMAISCDILVVGAGPAGSSAARAAAMGGAKTILIEKDPAAGMNIQCAESISKYLMPYLPFPIPKEQLTWEIIGMRFWAEGITIERTDEQWQGYNINREKFDKWLADEAVKAGAKFLTSTKLVDLDFNDDYIVKKAHVKTPKGEKEIKPKIVIGADGVKSTVARRLGVRKVRKGDIGELIAYDMRNLNLEHPHYDQIFFGDFAPGSYAYIMPKSRNVASVGVGTTIEENKRELERHFEEFIKLDIVKEQLKNRVIMDEKSGEAPVGYLTDKWIYGNVILTGDAANQNIKPFVEGIIPGIVCGEIAGRIASNTRSRYMDEEEYRQMVYTKLPQFRESDRMIDIIRSEGFRPHDTKRHLLHLGLCAEIFSTQEIIDLKETEYEVIMKRIERHLQK